MDHTMETKFASLEAMIGKTPMLEIEFRFRGKSLRLFAKAEYFNFTGSIKDRIAFYILKKAYETGALKPGQPIAEASSGNTGISFAAIGAYLGNPVTIIMPDWMSAERKELIASFGAKLRLLSRAEGGFTGSVALAREMGKQGYFLPEQFANQFNTETHLKSTGLEIVEQLAAKGLTADAFVCGVGTGGTVMGVGKILKDINPNCKVVAMDPASSPTLITKGKQFGPHRIAGIGDEFVPAIIHFEELDDLILVDDGDAINMTRKLAAKLGLGVGISSGANFLGALRLLKENENAVVVTTFADDNKKYLSTDLRFEQETKADWDSPDVDLIGFSASRGF